MRGVIKMNISILGQGYVDCDGDACCAKLGHHVLLMMCPRIRYI